MAKFSFDVKRSEEALIRKIVDRAAVDLLGMADCKSELTMDLIAIHANGCPLRLADLLEADRFNFAHDIYGIRRHLNRSAAADKVSMRAGLFDNHFRPRFAARKES